MSKHRIACVLEHVHMQIARVAEAGVALQTHAGLFPRVSPHVDLQIVALTEALHALVTPVELPIRSESSCGSSGWSSD